MAKNKSIPLILLVAGLLGVGFAQAHEFGNVSGSNVTRNRGSVAYSVAEGGVQDAYEIYNVGIKETALNISLSAFPIPTVDNLTLQISDYNNEKLSYQLFDYQGNLLNSKQIIAKQTKISMTGLPAATYFVNIVNQKSKKVQSFKIIKIYFIGQHFDGGVIFHLWKDSTGIEHGLIVDLVDLSTAHIWSNVSSTLIGLSAQSSWDGLSNSNAIVAQAGHTSSAAALCLNSINGGQSDWYLPSIDELSLMFQNRFNINKTLIQISGATQLSFHDYWSSTENGAASTYLFYMHAGHISSSGKLAPNYIRAVRAF